jgi:2-iminoacetate synthase ThiH
MLDSKNRIQHLLHIFEIKDKVSVPLSFILDEYSQKKRKEKAREKQFNHIMIESVGCFNFELDSGTTRISSTVVGIGNNNTS